MSQRRLRDQAMRWTLHTDRRYALSILLALGAGVSRPALTQEVQRVEVNEAGLVGRFYATGELEQQQLRNVRLEYVFEALEWLEARPEVRADRVVLIGESRGAELALTVASLRPDVAGVIAYSPSALRWGAVGGGAAAWTLHGRPLPHAEGRYDRAAPMRQYTEILDGSSEVRDAAAIEVERIRGPVLLLSSAADEVWPSARMANDIEARLRAHGFSCRIENVQYEEASHLLMGFGPALTEVRISDRFTMRFGGTAKGTQAARNAGWAQVKEFLARL